jgi:hypothetical protein
MERAGSIIVIRILSIILIFTSTTSAAQSLDDVFEALNLDSDVIKSMDTGFEADKDKYAFGAKRQLDKDTTLNVGVGAKYKTTPEYNLSNTYRGDSSQTNRLERDFDPMKSTPMLGMSVGYKFN